MGRLARGGMLILFFLVMNVFAAYVVSGMGATAAPTDSFSNGCSSSNNVTTCGDTGKEAFFQAVIGTTVTGFDGAPDFVNLMWVLIGVFLLALGILEAAFGVLPFYSE